MKHYILITLFLLTSSIVFSQTAKEYFDMGDSKYDLEDYIGAIKDYSKAIEINPNFADAYYNRGNAKSTEKGAIADYSKAIGINPNYADAYHKRGIAKLDLEDYEGAIADLSKAIEFNPDDADAYHVRGMAKLALEDYREAIADFTKAIEINPDDEWAYLRRGLAKSSFEDYEGSIQDLNEAIIMFDQMDFSNDDREVGLSLAHLVRGLAKVSIDKFACADFIAVKGHSKILRKYDSYNKTFLEAQNMMYEASKDLTIESKFDEKLKKYLLKTPDKLFLRTAKKMCKYCRKL